MENVVSKIRLAKKFFKDEYCLKTDKGKRLTCWFKTYEETLRGDFVKLETDIGTFVYHKNQPELLYENYVYGEEAHIYKLTDDIYYLQVNCSECCSLVQLYYSSGICTNMSALEDVCPIGNDLIAAKEVCGQWGILDKDLNWQVYPIYDEIYDFRNGFAFAIIEDEYTTDLLSVDEKGNIYIVTVDGHVVDYPYNDFVITRKNDKFGVYNTEGRKVLDFEYDDISFLRNHIILKKNNLYGLADMTVKILCECKYYRIIKTETGFELVTRKVVETTEYITV